MDYQEVLKYLYDQLPMFQRIGPAAFKKNLDNTLALCKALGNPHRKFKSLHVAGTNGKGSTSHMLAAILQTAGYKTGLYTSPHLKNFTERIRINGVEVPRAYVVDFVSRHKELVEKIRPSFFELTVAMAFDYFAQEQVDIAVIEVGLGGRLDSTNVITPLISIITNISYDHQAFLGNTLPEIAREKAGIIKEGVPVVISQTQKEVQEVFKVVSLKNKANLYFADASFTTESKGIVNNKLQIDTSDGDHEQSYSLDLIANYQLKNLPGVLKTVDLLREMNFNIPELAVKDGLSRVVETTGLKGRWQILEMNPLVICDTGHNEDGIRAVIDQITNTVHDKLYFIFGTVRDKDPLPILALLPKNGYYFFSEAQIPRALPATELYELAQGLGLAGEIILDVNEAIRKAKLKASDKDLIFVGGSNFIVAEIDTL